MTQIELEQSTLISLIYDGCRQVHNPSAQDCTVLVIAERYITINKYTYGCRHWCRSFTYQRIPRHRSWGLFREIQFSPVELNPVGGEDGATSQRI